jgi:hypothetical protein
MRRVTRTLGKGYPSKEGSAEPGEVPGDIAVEAIEAMLAPVNKPLACARCSASSPISVTNSVFAY